MDLILILIAIGAVLGASFEPPARPVAVAQVAAPQEAPEPEPEQAPEQAPEPETEPAPGFAAEDQTPTGQFTTAAEVRVILDATRGSWVAVRDYGGQDLLYFTQLLAWRCGLHQISYAINDEAEQVLETEPCYIGTGQPNAIRAETIQPYIVRAPGSVQSVTVRLVYDDLAEDSAGFARAMILLP